MATTLNSSVILRSSSTFFRRYVSIRMGFASHLTPLFETGAGMTAQEAEAFFDSFKNIYPVGRVGEVTDTSAAIEFLVNDSTASFITGLLLPVDGGALTAGK